MKKGSKRCLKPLMASLVIFSLVSAQTVALAQTKEQFWAKYEGGYPGLEKKHKGRIFFNNDTRELVFLKGGKQQLFSIPYESVTAVSADEVARRRVKEAVILGVTLIGLFALPILLSKKKLRYVVVEYTEPEKDTAGAAVFQVKGEDKSGVLALVAQKANLIRQEEELFVRASSVSEEAKGIVLLSSDPAAAEVYVDGAFIGNTPAKLELTPGSHRIRLFLVGYQHWLRNIEVVSGSEVNLTAVLEKSVRFH